MSRYAGNLSRVTFAEGTDTAEVQIFKPGKFRKGGREFVIGPHQYAEAIRNFESGVAGEVSTDYDHSFAEGGTSEASGWYKRLYEKDGALWASVEFTKEAAQKVRDKAFRFFSPEFHSNWADEKGKRHGFTILSGGLTNRPFLKNMAPITLSDEIDTAEFDEFQQWADLAEVFTAHSSERGREMGIRKEKTTTGEEPTVETLTARVAELEPLAEQVETLTSERDELKAKLTDAESGKTDAEKEVTKLADRLDAFEKQAFTEKRDALIEDARKQGKIDNTDETTTKWHTRADKFGVEGIRELLAEIKPGNAVPLEELGHGGAKPAAPSNEAERLTRLDERAMKLSEEKDIGYEEAVVLAEQELAS